LCGYKPLFSGGWRVYVWFSLQISLVLVCVFLRVSPYKCSARFFGINRKVVFKLCGFIGAGLLSQSKK
jgi:hypothetical protein